MKKLGTVIALDSDKMKGSLYLAKGDLLTPNAADARIYKGKPQVLENFCKQMESKFSDFTLSCKELWSDDFN